MNSIRTFSAALVAIALVSLANCKAEPAGPAAGTLVVSLAGPNTDDGAALFTLTGPGIRDAQSANSAYRVYWRLVSATELRLLVVGNLSSGIVATVSVDDRSQLSQYAGSVLEVASRDDVVRQSISGYRITVSR